MTDIEIIRAMEKILHVPLPRLEPGEIEQYYRNSKRGYSLDSTGAVAGLRLENLFIKPVLEYVDRLRRVTGLNIESCQLEQGDIDFLRGRGDLIFLNISNNKGIQDFSFLREFKGLTSLDLSNNNLTDVSFLRELKGLTSVDLGSNNLSDVSFLRELKGLTAVDLGSNNLSDVSFLRELKGLTAVDLSGNNLTDVSFVADLDHLSYLYIDENPVENPPPEIAAKGIEAIRSYFQQVAEQGKARLYEARLLLVGEPGAGKTTLLKKILDPRYPVPNTEEEPTLGIEINSQWEFPYGRDQSITFKTNIWDFGGQPIQYMLHQYFLTSRSLYVLVSDDREQRTRFDYWFDIIKVLGEKSPVLVVLNEKRHRSISNFDYDKYKKRYEPLYDIERRDVDFSGQDPRLAALIDKIAAMLSGLKHIGDELPRQWVPIRQELERIKKENQIGISRYFAICRQHGLTREQDMLILCGYLNALGVVLHYKNDRTLEDTIFVNPHWIVDALYTAISDKTPGINKGRFKKEWLFNLWERKGYTYDERCKLLNLMLKDNFEICYRMSGGQDEEYMVPMLLPDVEPGYELFPGSGTLKFRFQYPFMPEGIMARLIVRLHEHIEKQAGQDLTWKKGFILNRQGTRARVAEERSGKGLRIIDINVSGAAGSRRDLLAVIGNEVRKIHQKSFKEIEVEEMVPCNCPSCCRAEKPHYFEYSELQRYLRAGENIIKCSLSIKPVEIRQLIEEVVPWEETGQHYRVAQLLDSVTLPEERKREGFDFDMPEAKGPAAKLAPVSSADDGSRYENYFKLDQRIKSIEKQVAEARERKKYLDGRALGRVRRRYALLLGIDILFIAVIFLLLFKIKLAWNDIEPYTYIAGLVLFAGNLGYLVIKGHSFSLSGIYNKHLERERENFYRRDNFDSDRLKRLEEELKQAIKERDNLL